MVGQVFWWLVGQVFWWLVGQVFSVLSKLCVVCEVALLWPVCDEYPACIRL